MRSDEQEGGGRAKVATSPAGAFRIRRLNHAVLYVADIDRSVKFYTEVLGFETISRLEAAAAAFLRAPGSANHHDLGLFGLGPAAQRPTRGQTGLYHLAWQVDTIDELVAARAALAAAGALVGESSHGAAKSLYAQDPDGNEFETMWMVPRKDWGRYEREAVVEPLDLAADVERWSGIGTANQTDLLSADDVR